MISDHIKLLPISWAAFNETKETRNLVCGNYCTRREELGYA